MTFTLSVFIRILGDAIVEEIEKKGGKAFICNTPVVSDAETMVLNIDIYKDVIAISGVP